MRYAYILLTMGCATLPYSAPTDQEEEAFAAVAQSWAEHGRDVEISQCANLTRIRMLRGSQEDVRVWCRRPDVSAILACTWAGRDSLFSPLYSTIAISIYGSDANNLTSHRTRISLAMHEYGHQIRSCWIQQASPADYTERFQAGRETRECSIRTAYDHSHCDREMWTTLHNRAMEIWENE